MNEVVSVYSMRDPTAELSPVMRDRKRPPDSLHGCTIGLLSISKERSAEYLDSVEALVASHLPDVSVKRFEKPTHTKPAPESVLQHVIEDCEVVVIGLAD